MSDHCQEPLCCKPDDLRSALAIHTQKITDSCRDKDCIEDLRVYLTRESQTMLDSTNNAKVRSADLIYTAVNVSPMGLRTNHYCVDLAFYYKILADTMIGTCKPATLYGLAVFNKRAVLCGEVAGTHVFTSDNRCPEFCTEQLPRAVVEVLDPMVLSSRIGCGCTPEPCKLQFPEAVMAYFEDELVLGGDRQRLYVTLGQFSVIRLERPVQLIVPVLDYSLPTKECCDSPGATENPCELFARVPFPTEEFVPTGCDNRPGDGCGCDCDRYHTT